MKIKLNSRQTVLTKWVMTGALIAMLSVSGRSATIVWDSVGSITAVSDIATQGTSLQAYNLGNSGFSSVVNGVTFASVGVSGSGPYTIGSGTGSLAFSDVVAEAGGFGYLGSGGGPQGALDSGYQSFLGSGIYNGTNPMALSITGLTVANDYLVQFWVNDSRNIPVVWSRTQTFSAGNTSGTLDFNVQNQDGGLGQYVVGRFTADSATQIITASSATFQLNGYQLRDITVVPEPSTYALLGLAGLLSFVLRRARLVKA
jgi:hypothetical protein